MGEFENTIIIFLIVFMIGLGVFFGSIDYSSSANDTNVTNNSSNSSNNTTGPVKLAASGWNPQVSISVTSSVNLTQLPDGLQSSYPNVVQVNATGREWLGGGDKLNLYVNASGDFSSGSSTIPLNNLKYNGFDNSTLPITSFTTTKALINSWPMELSTWYGTYEASASVNGNYYMTVPMGTAGGTYTTYVTYTAMIE